MFSPFIQVRSKIMFGKHIFKADNKLPNSSACKGFSSAINYLNTSLMCEGIWFTIGPEVGRLTILVADWALDTEGPKGTSINWDWRPSLWRPWSIIQQSCRKEAYIGLPIDWRIDPLDNNETHHSRFWDNFINLRCYPNRVARLQYYKMIQVIDNLHG